VAVYGAQITLDLPETFGKAHRRVNICCLKFFEALDACFVESDARPTPLVGGAGVTCYEVSRISDAQMHKGQHELWVEWRGYDQSHNCWVNCDVLMVDVPALVVAFDTQPSIFQAPASAPKRATTGYKSVVHSEHSEKQMVETERPRLLGIVNCAAMTAARHGRENLNGDAALSSEQGEGAPDSSGGAMPRSRGTWRLLRPQEPRLTGVFEDADAEEHGHGGVVGRGRRA